tara:strand:- start:1375 stop:1755 length:381 start_codon:yes stop_codon:yes gene_type:complete
MAKSIANAVLDAALNHVADNGSVMHVCSQEPTDYTQASSTYKLADVALSVGDGNGDYTVADGDSGGRKLTVAEQSSVTVDTTGTATHIAICSGSALLLVTTCTSQAITSGNTITIPSFNETIGDPT